MFELDVRSRVPIYEQLVEKIKELIIKGLLKEHEQLPSVRALSNDLTINPNTIQKAYRELENQGYIYSIPGKGSFVAPLKDKDINKEKIEKILEEIKKLMLEGFHLGMNREDIIKVLEDVVKIKEGK
ncbi:MAG: GntR family transcriptional regulator [Caloramator sp.]|nr:GntR family transcriptional regulator [Caloramator sp.]